MCCEPESAQRGSRGRTSRWASRLFGGRQVLALAVVQLFCRPAVVSADPVEEDEVQVLPTLFGEEEPPPFFDYDCDVASTKPGAVFDWNLLYDHVKRTVSWNESDYSFPQAFRFLLEGPLANVTEQECPLGVLYLRILLFYDVYHYEAPRRELMQEMSQHIQMLLRSFPVYAIALSRWPIFFAFEHFSPTHVDDPSLFCEEDKGLLDWASLRSMSQRWASLKRDPEGSSAEETQALERSIADLFLVMLRSKSAQEQAQTECEFGFYFLVANQVVAAASRETHHLPPFNYIMDKIMYMIPFIRLATCGWPIFAVLVIFSDLNKGIWFFGGDRKYLRGYSDWNLRRDELSPLAPSGLDFLSLAWRAEVEEGTETLAKLPASEYTMEVYKRIRRKEHADGIPMRPIVQGLVEAAISVAAVAAPVSDLGGTGASRRLAFVVLLYGKKWSAVLARMARRLRQLRIRQPLLVISIGEEAAAVCRALGDGHVEGGDAVGQPPAPHVVCWRPESQSQVHRFTAVHAMLHMGVDVLYMDMDTYLVRDPLPRIMEQAKGSEGGEPLEALFARHADADCVNIGVFYLRATANTAIWMSQYLAWYHDHPFEIDQRGLHVFLGIPSKSMNIAYKPMHLVKVRAGILEDVNEIVIGDVGWAGELSRMIIFHWCHRPIELKEEELSLAYDAGDVLEAHNLPLHLAIQVSRAALPDTSWAKVSEFRAVMEAYHKEAPPERTPCW